MRESEGRVRGGRRRDGKSERKGGRRESTKQRGKVLSGRNDNVMEENDDDIKI